MGLSSEEKKHMNSVLNSVSCGELVKDQHPITIPATATIAQACEILASHSILSALVESPDGHGYSGVFSYRSLLHYFLKECPPDGEIPSAPANLDLRSVILSAKPNVLASDFCKEKNKDFFKVLADQPLYDAIVLFSKGIHRCSVVKMNEQGDEEIVGTLSQSLALRYLSNHLIEIKDVVSRPLSSFPNIGNRTAVTIEERRNVIEGMEVMHRLKLSSLPVVDSSGKLSGNFSLSDIKFIFRTKSYPMLWYTVGSFVKLLREKHALESNSGMDTFPFFDITREKSLNLAIQKMVATRVHHLWLVDANGKPTGVVGITDVMRCITE